MDLIAQLEAEQIAALGKTIPDFKPGDTVRVGYKVPTVRSRPFATPLATPSARAMCCSTSLPSPPTAFMTRRLSDVSLHSHCFVD